MNFLQLCQTVRRELGYSGTGPITVVNQAGQYLDIVNWVADAAYEIESIWNNWDFMWTQYSDTLTTGDPVPVGGNPANLNVWDVDSFYVDYTTADFARLTYLPYADYRENYRNGTQSPGTPRFITVLPNKTLRVHQVPEKAYTLTADYWRVPTKMAADSDTSAIPALYHRIIVSLALIYGAARDNAPEVMQKATAEYTDQLQKLESAYLPNNPQSRMSSPEEFTIRVE